MAEKTNALNLAVPRWVGIKSTEQVGFVVKELDGGARFWVMVVYGVDKDNIADAFKVVNKHDLTEVKDIDMIKLLYDKEK